MIMTPEEKYRDLYEQMYELCEEQGWGDPFSYARSRELYMAGLLGHKVADDYAGEDAIDEFGGCEYKSTIGKNVNGTYNGCLLYTSPSPRDSSESRMPSSA